MEFECVSVSTCFNHIPVMIRSDDVHVRGFSNHGSTVMVLEHPPTKYYAVQHCHGRRRLMSMHGASRGVTRQWPCTAARLMTGSGVKVTTLMISLHSL